MPRTAPGHRALVALLLAGLLAVLALRALAPPSTAIYLDVVRVAGEWPAWTHAAWELVSEAGLVVLAGLLAFAARRARRTGTAPVALALVVGGAALVAYGLSEAVKLVALQERPCQSLAVEVIASCPPTGDWSLPSNHATIAAALAAAVVALVPRLGLVAVALGVAVASSRVALGVHYPHDVVTGLALGGVVVAAAALSAPTMAGYRRRAVRRTAASPS